MRRSVCYLDCWRDNPVETLLMFRTPIIAGLTVALLGGTALGVTSLILAWRVIGRTLLPTGVAEKVS